MNDRMPPSAGDIDDLLTDFFHREVPNPWPRMAAPDSSPKELIAVHRVSRKRAPMPGRYALAASIALLAALGVLMSNRAPTPITGPGLNLNAGEANLRPRNKPSELRPEKVDLRELNRQVN